MAKIFPRAALRLLDRLLRGRVSAQALAGAEIAYRQGDRVAAARLLEVVVQAAPSEPTRLARAGVLSEALGDRAQALELSERALRLDPANAVGTILRADLEMPGPNYATLLAQIHATLRPRCYLEIGIFEGDTLRLAGPGTRAIGVDPAPKVSRPLPAHARVYAMTSDAFFAGPAAEALAGSPIDLAFIDGLHHCEFALRDFINIERHCSPAGTVLLHDCYPLNRITAEREQRTEFWCGDIWRTIVALRRHRPDLRIHTVATVPSGLAVVRGLDSASRTLADRYDAVVAEMMAMDYSELDKDKPGLLNRFPNDWPRIAALLAA